jgi:hypothetical protein
MQIKNVGELLDFISQLPREMEVEGYDGDGNVHPVSVYRSGYEEINLPDTLIIDVDN